MHSYNCMGLLDIPLGLYENTKIRKREMIKKLGLFFQARSTIYSGAVFIRIKHMKDRFCSYLIEWFLMTVLIVPIIPLFGILTSVSKSYLSCELVKQADGLLVELTVSSCYDFIEQSCEFVLKHLPAMQKLRCDSNLSLEYGCYLLFSSPYLI